VQQLAKMQHLTELDQGSTPLGRAGERQLRDRPSSIPLGDAKDYLKP
jgi:hypothetical protein